MIKINLLPIRQTRKTEALRRETVLAGLLGAVVVGGCLFIWAGLSIRVSSVSAENAALNSEIARLAEDVKKVDEMEKFKAELERKLEVIAALRAKKTGPAHMMDELALSAPEKLQLTLISEHNGAVELDGLAVSNEVISQFLRSLEASEYFEQVYLKNIEAFEAKDKSASVMLKQFALTARLVEAAPPPADGAKPGSTAPGAPAPEGTAPAGAPPSEAAPAAPGAAPAPAEAAAAPAPGATP